MHALQYFLVCYKHDSLPLGPIRAFMFEYRRAPSPFILTIYLHVVKKLSPEKWRSFLAYFVLKGCIFEARHVFLDKNKQKYYQIDLALKMISKSKYHF